MITTVQQICKLTEILDGVSPSSVNMMELEKIESTLRVNLTFSDNSIAVYNINWLGELEEIEVEGSIVDA